MKYIYNVEVTYEIDLSQLHDTLLGLTGKSYDFDGLIKVFDLLPDDIKNLAYQWGGTDSVFRDDAYEYLEQNLDLIK